MESFEVKKSPWSMHTPTQRHKNPTPLRDKIIGKGGFRAGNGNGFLEIMCWVTNLGSQLLMV